MCNWRVGPVCHDDLCLLLNFNITNKVLVPVSVRVLTFPVLCFELGFYLLFPCVFWWSGFSIQQGQLCHLLLLLKNTDTLSEEELASLSILMSDFQSSLASVQPSAKREGFATVPDVTWDDVGALQDIREELTMAILVNCTLFTLIQTEKSLIPTMRSLFCNK